MGCTHHNLRQELYNHFADSLEASLKLKANDEYSKQVTEFKTKYGPWEASTHDRYNCRFNI